MLQLSRCTSLQHVILANPRVKDHREQMDTIHATASIPAQADRRAEGKHLWGRPSMTSQFTKDIARHEMTICHDDGLYRHLRFACQPVPYVEPCTSNRSFQLFTAPGTLGISGDMGTYIFARLQDMFRFFDAPAGRINPEYWSEKVTAQDVHCPIRTFSQEKFKEVVLQDFQDRKYAFEPAEQELLLSKLKRDVLGDPDTYHEVGAREALRNFVFYSKRPGEQRIEFDYSESWEMDFNDFSYHFLWCLEAIVFGIARYRKVTGNV